MTEPEPDRVNIYLRIGAGPEHRIGHLRQPVDVAQAAPGLLAALLREAASIVERTPFAELQETFGRPQSTEEGAQ